jgi:hypothetical protein
MHAPCLRNAVALRLFLLAVCALASVGVAADAALLAQAGRAARERVHDAAPAVQFRDISAAAGLDVTHVNGASRDKYFAEIMGSGALFFDMDADGWLDAFLVDGGSIADRRVAGTARHRLYRNRGDGTFEDVTARSGIRHAGYGMGACAADYDNDGRVDLYITNYGPNQLYRNEGDGRFAAVPDAGGAGSALWSTSCAFADVDNDGLVDLFVTNYVQADPADNRLCTTPRSAMRAYCHPLTYAPLTSLLYKNRGRGRFEDVSAAAGIAAFRGNGLGVAVADIDDDGFVDLFVANDGTPNFLFRNRGDGTFEEGGLLAGVSVAADGRARAGMGTAFGDVDGDGRPDLVVTNHEFEMHALFRNLGDGLFADATLATGLGPLTLPYVGFGVAIVDVDNDTQRDLVIVNGNVVDNIAEFRPGGRHAQPNLLLRNDGGRFRLSNHPGDALQVSGVSRALAAGDIDNDGDVDLLVTNNGGRAQLLANEGVRRGSALLIRVTGTRSNRDGLGARLRLTVGTRTFVAQVTSGSSYLAQHDLRVHFGLGTASRADRLEIRWPSGLVDVVTDLPGDHIVTIREGAGAVGREAIRR